MAHYEVTLEGFTVQSQTWDNLLNTDGWADEVYLHTDVRRIDPAGTELPYAGGLTSYVMGDTNGFPFRVQAGSATPRGGLKTGNEFPYPQPWARQGELRVKQPPMILWAGELKSDDEAVVITPTIWEWDGASSLFNDWSQAVATNGPAIAAAVLQVVALIKGGVPLPGDSIKSALETAMPAASRLEQQIIGQAGDRPIGMVEEDSSYVFRPKSQIITNKLAEVIQTNDVGYGLGVMEIAYVDAARLAGHYLLYTKVTKVEESISFEDGVLLRDQSSAPVYVVYGGAKFWIPDPMTLSHYAPHMWEDVRIVPDGTLAAIPAIPRDNTVLREWSFAPVYVMLAGQKRRIRDPQHLDKYTGGQRWSRVRVVPNGALAAIPAGAEAP